MTAWDLIKRKLMVREGKEYNYYLNSQQMYINWFCSVFNISMKYDVLPQNGMFTNLIDFTSEETISLNYLLPPFYFSESIMH